jgi:hypothetical protein
MALISNSHGSEPREIVTSGPFRSMNDEVQRLQAARYMLAA